jgi:hypothetical protein
MFGRSSKTAVLQKVPLFRDLSRKQLDQIGRLADEIEVPAGKVPARTGERGHELYVIVNGQAVARHQDPRAPHPVVRGRGASRNIPPRRSRSCCNDSLVNTYTHAGGRGPDTLYMRLGHITGLMQTKRRLSHPGDVKPDGAREQGGQFVRDDLRNTSPRPGATDSNIPAPTRVARPSPPPVCRSTCAPFAMPNRSRGGSLARLTYA